MHVRVTVQSKAIRWAPQRATARGVRSPQLANARGKRINSLLPRRACARPSSRMEGGQGQQAPACRERRKRGEYKQKENEKAHIVTMVSFSVIRRQLLPIPMQKKTTACHSGRRQSISSVDSSWSSCPSSVTSTAGPPSHRTTPVTARVHMQHAPSAGPPHSHQITSRSRSRKNFTVHS